MTSFNFAILISQLWLMAYWILDKEVFSAFMSAAWLVAALIISHYEN